MNALAVAFTTVFLAEMGDRTQILALLLATRFRRTWPIIAGIFVATLVNHAISGALGVWVGRFLTPSMLSGVVGVSMIVMAAWALLPEKAEPDARVAGHNAFAATVAAFFVAEMGDKTQIATVALAAGYAASVVWIVAGTTLGMLAANIPVVFLGNAFANRIPVRMINFVASALFTAIGVYFIIRAFI